MSEGLSDGPRLKQTELMFMREIEKKNAERVALLKRTRKNNSIVGLSLAVGVFAIYGYSIWAVKQETFLDDFNRPEKVLK